MVILPSLNLDSFYILEIPFESAPVVRVNVNLLFLASSSSLQPATYANFTAKTLTYNNDFVIGEK